MYVSLAVVMDESTLEITDCIFSMGVVALAWWVDRVFVSAMRLLSNWLWYVTIVVRLSSCCFMVWIISWVRLLVGVVLVGWWLCWGWSGEVLRMLVWAVFCGGVGMVQVVCGIIAVGAWVWGGFVGWVMDCIGSRGCLGWDWFFFV